MISLHMLVLNEAERLPKLLEHVRRHVTDMHIVVDDRTTDRSVAIARKFGAWVYKVNLNHDFAAARNFGLEQVTQPWVLQIDGDEWPKNCLLKWIRMFLGSPEEKNTDLVSVWRENLIDGKPIGCHTYEWQHRLFRSHMRFIGRIHETVPPPAGRRVLAPRKCLLLHHKTSAMQEASNRRYLEWPEQRAIVGVE